MRRKQLRKSLMWRRFGYVILIIIKFLLWISPSIINAVRSYIKHLKECFIRYQNNSRMVIKNLSYALFFNPPLSVWISDETLFLVFDILVTLPSLLAISGINHRFSLGEYVSDISQFVLKGLVLTHPHLDEIFQCLPTTTHGLTKS